MEQSRRAAGTGTSLELSSAQGKSSRVPARTWGRARVGVGSPAARGARRAGVGGAAPRGGAGREEAVLPPAEQRAATRRP